MDKLPMTLVTIHFTSFIYFEGILITNKVLVQ